MNDNKRDEIKDRIHQARDDINADDRTGEEATSDGTPGAKRAAAIKRTAEAD